MVHAFLDDSNTDEVVICAAAVFAEDRVAEAEAVLAEAKRSVGLTEGDEIHCRVIFSGNERRGTAWAAVSSRAISDLVAGVCTALKPISRQPVVCVAERAVIPPETVAADSPLGPLNAKGVATITYSAVFGALADRFGSDQVRAWIDPEPNQIPWGGGYRQAQRTRTVFLDLGAGKEPPHFAPIVEDAPRPALLEIADVYAYVAARAHSRRGGWRTQWCQDLYRVMEPDRLVFEFERHPRWERA